MFHGYKPYEWWFNPHVQRHSEYSVMVGKYMALQFMDYDTPQSVV